MDDKVDKLLVEYDEHRDYIKEMIKDLEGIRAHVDKLFPESLDKRYIRFFQEKVQAATSLFNSLLDMRKEIAKSIKDEIEIRRKIDKEYNEEEDNLDIREIAKSVEKLQQSKKRLEITKDKVVDMKQAEGGL